ncbi:MAG: hypothetical protein QM539_07075 [Alphaproteobacteria bacterium]|nr:hypothetical protein [Alphaproteobacteria bacterium]
MTHHTETKFENPKELVYVIDESAGKLKTELSAGWTPKAIALEFTLEVLANELEEIKQKCLLNKTSPIVYFMKLNRMDWQTLAAYMHKSVWLIKFHNVPFVFKKLSHTTIQKYARIFKIDVNALKCFNHNYHGKTI